MECEECKKLVKRGKFNKYKHFCNSVCYKKYKYKNDKGYRKKCRERSKEYYKKNKLRLNLKSKKGYEEVKDDLKEIRRKEKMRVTGEIISNPRIFLDKL